MILSAHQPAYLPWLGYFDKIARADVFVYLDTVQFEKGSFIYRNQIKAPHGVIWLTIPIKKKGYMNGSLRTTEINESLPWRTKHLKLIEVHYRKAPHFDEFYPKIEALLSIPESNLADYCYHQLRFWLDELGIDTRVVRSSELPVSSAKSDLNLDLCQFFGAQQYLSGAQGRAYLIEKDFSNAGIEIEYQDFQSPIYPQLWGTFVPNMSVVDLLFNVSPQSFEVLMSGNIETQTLQFLSNL